jgi:hypothetical protein
MTTVLFLGFLIGMRHAVEADHVAAVASLVTRSQSFGESIRLGSAWGLGHTLTLFFFGSVVILMDVMIPERMAMMLEFTVGIMLVVLGVDVIRRVIRERIHFHAHQHGDSIRHFHAHSHAGEGRHEDSPHEHEHPKRFPLRALLIGMMHGMAGSAALIVLTLQTVTSPLAGLIYMLLFGLGSMIGMALLSAIIMIPIRHSAKRLTWLYNGLQATVGTGTLLLGSYVVFEIGFIEGLII